MMNEMKKVLLVTHSGVFHADDVFSSAFLKYYFGDVTIVRTARPDSVDQTGFNTVVVFDIGGGEFDHHQVDHECRENGIPYAAFGLLWRRFAPELFSENFVQSFDDAFVSAIDAQDNGVAPNPLSMSISAFNPNWDSEDTTDACFEEAVDFAYTILMKHFERNASKERARDEALAAAEKAEGSVAVLERYVPFKEHLSTTEVKLVVHPSNRGGWNIATVPDPAGAPFSNKVSLPESWLETLPDGCTFVHPGRFIASFNTRESAVKAAKEVVRAAK